MGSGPTPDALRSALERARDMGWRDGYEAGRAVGAREARAAARRDRERARAQRRDVLADRAARMRSVGCTYKDIAWALLVSEGTASDLVAERATWADRGGPSKQGGRKVER